MENKSNGIKHGGIQQSWKYDDVISGFRCIPFFWRRSPYPNIHAFLNLKGNFKAVLGDKSVTSGIGKGR